MADSYSNSKLKRKKCFVEDNQPETSSWGALKRSHTAVFSGDMTAESTRSAYPATVWWNRERLPVLESLWALTLKSALPYLEHQHRGLVPDLPYPTTARPTALQFDEQRWCNLGEKVAPFPEPSPRTSLSPDPLRLSSSQQDLSVPTKPVPEPTDGQLSSHSRQGHNGKTTSLQDLIKRPQSSLHGWEGAASSGGPSNVGGGEDRKGGEQGSETGPVNRQLLTNQVKNKEEEEVQRTVRGDGEAVGGGGLQSCPMCLLVFPAGFTQMDCDGHLAQCLSEVNVDVTW